MRMCGLRPALALRWRCGRAAWQHRNVPRPFTECIRSYFFIGVSGGRCTQRAATRHTRHPPHTLTHGTAEMGRTEDGAGPDGGGVIDEHVEVAEARDGLVDGALHLVLVANVALDGQRLAARRLHLLRHRVNRAGQLRVRLGRLRSDHHIRSVLCAAQRDAAADAAAGALGMVRGAGGAGGAHCDEDGAALEGKAAACGHLRQLRHGGQANEARERWDAARAARPRPPPRPGRR